MPGKWQDDQEQWRPRDDEPFFYGRERERRSWERDRPDTYGARRSGPGRDPVFGERETGASYGSSNGRPRGAPRISPQDYTRGGRYYGDDSRERIYREEYGQGGVDYGPVPRGYEEGSRFGSRRLDERYAREMRRPVSGGTGGYDYDERGYGDAGRTEYRPDRGRDAGDFLHRAGERISSWFGNVAGEVRRDLGRDDDERGYEEFRGHRGRGPQGYKRSDERINDDAHQRLTDDAWLDATNIVVSVSGGEVTLSGTVDSRESKHRAERIVEDVSGVAHVQNNLRCAASSTLSDTAFEAQPRKDDPAANGTGGAGGGQSTAGRKN